MRETVIVARNRADDLENELERVRAEMGKRAGTFLCESAWASLLLTKCYVRENGPYVIARMALLWLSGASALHPHDRTRQHTPRTMTYRQQLSDHEAAHGMRGDAHCVKVRLPCILIAG